MSIDFAALTLVPATRAQTIEARKRTYPQWGSGLTEDAYLQRDADLETHEHAVNGGVRTWVLVRRDEPESLDFLCACETHRRKVLVIKKGDSQAEEVIGYGVASVYTPPRNRGKGYGQQMMRLLHWVIAPRTTAATLPASAFPEEWGAPPEWQGDGRFSVLYSDIGETFYRSSAPGESTSLGEGWVVRGAIATLWDVGPSSKAVGSEAQLTWRDLNEAGATEVWKRDAELMKRDLVSAAGKPDAGTALFSFTPDQGVSAVQTRRMGYYGDVMAKNGLKWLTAWGVVLEPTGSPDEVSFATWAIDTPTTLIVTRLRSTESAFPSLLDKITDAARQSGLAKVEVWNVPKNLEVLAAKLLNAKTEDRTNHLSAFRWYGEETPDKVEWLFNEKFCWC